jgi:predicted ATPase/DNA-binding SARP family transcriptional activator
MLRLFLFGALRIEHNGVPVLLGRSRAQALLAYLALSRQPLERARLLALLWPEFDTDSARNNLRRELSLLKTSLSNELLVADRRTVAWNMQAAAWVDVAVFQDQVAAWTQHGHPAEELCSACAAGLAAAVQLAGDDLLAGFTLPDSAAFDEWLFFQREGLRRQLAGALEALASWHARRGEYDRALEFARRRLALDPLHEPAQRMLMRLYAWAGWHAAALRQYEACAQLLQAELGGEPEAETTRLYEQIKARRIEPPTQRVPSAPATSVPAITGSGAPISTAAPPYRLPSTAGFVGRQRELADLIRRLTDPACRLLTLAGPGGIGKTRLALQAAHTLAETWAGDDEIADGVLFVPLAGVESTNGLVAALAAAAGLDFYPGVPPQQQLLDFLQPRRMLVVLDNVEQLTDATALIGDLVAAAPRLRLLVTSRVALNLQAEWFHPLDGLSFPAGGEATTGVAQLARFDAVRLFELHARRVRGDFLLGRAWAPVMRLCRLVDGMPLAIELAAAWLKALSVEQVVAELERGLDILTTRDKTTPERHRSMRTVLEGSWRLLEVEEQQALAGLSMFRGEFSAAAAQAVTGATFAMLASLIDHSFLRSGPDSRFQLHELLRQFAAEKLAADSQAQVTARERHSAYYLAWLTTHSNAFVRGEDQAGLAEISRDSENIRAAWSWAAAQGDSDVIGRSLEPMFNLYRHQNRYQEGQDDFALAAAHVQLAGTHAAPHEPKPVYARLLAYQGALCAERGDYSAAVTLLEQSKQAAQTLGHTDLEAFVLTTLGRMAVARGDYGFARQCLEQSLTMSRALGDTANTAAVLEKLAEALNDLGEYHEARQLAQESLALSRELRRPDALAHALDRLGYISYSMGEYQEAAAYFRESLALFDAIGHQHGKGLALGALGFIAWAQQGGASAEALAYYEQSLAIFRKMGHQQHIIERLNDLSQHAIDRGDYTQAQIYAEEGLLLARRIGSPLYESMHLCCLGRVASDQGDLQAGRAFLAESLQIAAAAQIALAGLKALLYAAALLIKASLRAQEGAPTAIQARLQALTLLEIAIHNPALRHVFQLRARKLSADVRRDLPAQLVEAACDRSRQLDWQAGVALALANFEQLDLA